MRIGVVIYGSLDDVSGGYLYDRMLVDYLRRQGEQVEIISLPWRNYASHLTDNLSPGLYRRLERIQIDVMIQDELNHPSLFWLNRRLRKSVARGYPIVSIVHHLRSNERAPAFLTWVYQQVERLYLSSVDGFIFNSQTTRREVEMLTGNEPPSVVAYPAGGQFHPLIQESDIEARARQGGPLRLIFIGNLIPRKGLDTLLDAIQQLPEDTARLTVIGSPQVAPAYAKKLRARVADSNLGNCVTFLGFQQEKDLAAQIESHQLLVVPSTYEGFGIVYLEGMGFGLPAIGSTAGGAAEIITDGQDGFLIAPGDHATLRHTLTRLYEDRQLLSTMSVAARRRFLSQPTWEETCAAIHDYLRSFAGNTALSYPVLRADGQLYG